MLRMVGVALVIGASLACAADASAAGNPCRDSVRTAVPQPTPAQLAAAGLGGLPVAPAGKRVDLVAPPFSNPTRVTNPLFPISELHSVVLNGHVEGKPFRTETTLLPETRIVEWSPGQCVRTLVSQYVAYVGGRIEEVALDRYAQADDGSVWYFGEDVFNYEHGVVEETSDSWLAGKEGPAAMIMPGAPRVGDVNRAENIPGLVFEEVAVRAIGRTVAGPRGPVAGAMVARELHDDGTFSDKIFAPGYGEFRTAEGGELEALALAVPTDALPGPPPAALRRLATGAIRAFRAAGHWHRTGAIARVLESAWKAQRANGVPRRLVAPTRRALRSLTRAVDARKRGRARDAALAVRRAALDLELQFRSPLDIDRARFDLWARRTRLDARRGMPDATSGDVAVLEWIRDRIAHPLESVAVARLDARLIELRANVVDGELATAARTAAALRRALAAARPVG
jgi:hypothetical protein